MALSQQERTVLRDLAARVAEIARDPVQQENIARWKNLNALRRGRPLIQCAPPMEVWPELMPESEMVVAAPKTSAGNQRLDAADTFKEGGADSVRQLFRAIEGDLRRRIHRWEHIRDDEVTTAAVYIPSGHRFTDWYEGRSRPYSGQADRAGRFEPCVVDFGDLKKLRAPELIVETEQSDPRLEAVQELLGEILDVKQEFPYQAGMYHSPLGWGTSAMDIFCELRGLDQVMLDLCMNPDFVHEAMEFITCGIMRAFDALEREGLLRLNDNETVVGPGGQGWTDDLPGDGYAGGPVMRAHLWGYAQTQELAGVSPEMLAEFVLPYQARMTAPFGLNYYGCCEPNDRKWGVIMEQIPHLRGLSVSPWSDHEVAASILEDKYIYSWKPHPAKMIGTFDEDFIRAELRRVFDITRGCIVAVSLRDVQTVEGEPGRLSRWAEIGREIAVEYE